MSTADNGLPESWADADQLDPDLARPRRRAKAKAAPKPEPAPDTDADTAFQPGADGDEDGDLLVGTPTADDDADDPEIPTRADARAELLALKDTDPDRVGDRAGEIVALIAGCPSDEIAAWREDLATKGKFITAARFDEILKVQRKARAVAASKRAAGQWPAPLRDKYHFGGRAGHARGVFMWITDMNGQPARLRLADADIRIVHSYYRDLDEPYPATDAVAIATAGPDERTIDWYDLDVTTVDNTTGTPLRVPGVTREALESLAFLRRPGTGLAKVAIDPRRDNRAHLAQAIQSKSDPTERPAYDRIGWHVRGDEVFFVHAGGAIDASGPREDVVFRGDGMTEWFHFPDPPDDIETGRAAVLAVLRLFDLCPERVAAAMLGAAFRCLMGRAKGSLTFDVVNRSGKSGVMAFVCQIAAPRTRWDHFPTPGAEKQNLSEAQAERLLNALGDVLLPLDDISSDDSAETQRKQFSRLARAVYNRSFRGRMNRDRTQGDIRPPRCMLALTMEGLAATESAENRTHIIAFGRGDVSLSGLKDADGNGGPRLRARAGAGFVQWWAKRMPATEEVLERRAEAEARLHEDLGADFPARYMEEMADGILAGGWAFVEYAEEQGYLTGIEAEGYRARFTAGVVESTRAQAARMAGGTLAARSISRLLDVLAGNRSAHLTTRKGEKPPNSGRLGWSDEDRPNGTRIGYTDDGKLLWLIPSAAFTEIRRAFEGTSDAFTTSQRGLAKMLVEEKFISQYTHGGRSECGQQVRIGRDAPRIFWDIRLPDEDEDGDDRPDTPPPPGPAVAASWASTTPATPAPEVARPETPAATTERKAPTKRTTPKATRPAGARPAKVVAYAIGAQGVMASDGTTQALPTPATLPAVLDMLTAADRVTQIVVTADALPTLKLPKATPVAFLDDDRKGGTAKLPAAYTDLSTAGWAGYGEDGAFPRIAWARIHRGDRHADLIVRPWWEGSAALDGDDPATWLRRLEGVGAAVGDAWGPAEGSTALRLIRRKLEMAKTRNPLFVAGSSWPPAVVAASERRVGDWARPITTDERAGYLHRYDGVKAYLTHYRTPLAVEDLTEGGAQQFDPRHAGFWLVSSSPWESPELPAPWSCYVDTDPTTRPEWLPTSIVALMVERGLTVDVIDSWTAPAVEQTGMREFVTTISTALDRAKSDPVLKGMVKSLYHAGYGAMKSQSRVIRRPDWYSAIQASAWTAQLRKVYRVHDDTGRAPVAIHVDAVTYAAPTADPTKAVPALNGPKRSTLGTELGQYKPEHTERGEDHAA